MNMRLNLGGVKYLELKRILVLNIMCIIYKVTLLLQKKLLSSPDSSFWKEAINDEMNSIISNNTWKLVDLPLGCKTIGCKWVLRRKLKPGGSIEEFKVRLVAKGFKQKEDIDFSIHFLQSLKLHLLDY